jgi:hypothetical protein
MIGGIPSRSHSDPKVEIEQKYWSWRVAEVDAFLLQDR